MKKNKEILEDLRRKDLGRLSEDLDKTRKELFKIRFSVKNTHSKSSHLIAVDKKNIARIKTVMKEGAAKASK